MTTDKKDEATAPSFATATAPAASGAIITHSANIETAQITISTQGDMMPAWYARPKKHGGHLPVVLVIQEIFGVHEHIRDICRRLAIEGYLAVAPELYFRQGDPSRYSDIGQLFRELVSHVPDTQVLTDLDHVANWSVSHGGDMRKLAITGFCWGGRISWLYAAHNPQLKAAVAWYGKLTGEKSLPQPTNPIDVVDKLSTPVLGLYGAHDKSIPLTDVEAMQQALTDAGSGARIVVYPDAGHAFFADYRPTYHAPSAKDAWQRMLDWFHHHGVQPGG